MGVLCRGKVQPLLDDLCRGLRDGRELQAALEGLLAAQPHVRAAALEALPEVPSLAAGASPLHGHETEPSNCWELRAFLTSSHALALEENVQPCLQSWLLLVPASIMVMLAGTAPTDAALVTILWLAQHDPDAANAEAALVLWDSCDCHLPHSFLGHLLPYLHHQQSDVRIAAAEALSFGLQVHHPHTVCKYKAAGCMFPANLTAPCWAAPQSQRTRNIPSRKHRRPRKARWVPCWMGTRMEVHGRRGVGPLWLCSHAPASGVPRMSPWRWSSSWALPWQIMTTSFAARWWQQVGMSMSYACVRTLPMQRFTLLIGIAQEHRGSR